MTADVIALVAVLLLAVVILVIGERQKRASAARRAQLDRALRAWLENDKP